MIQRPSGLDRVRYYLTHIIDEVATLEQHWDPSRHASSVRIPVHGALIRHQRDACTTPFQVMQVAYAICICNLLMQAFLLILNPQSSIRNSPRVPFEVTSLPPQLHISSSRHLETS